MRQARRKRLLRWGGLSAILLVSALFIVSLILPSLPVFNFGGGGGGNIFETGATESTSGAAAPADTSQVEAVAAPAEDTTASDAAQTGVAITYNCPEGCDDLVQQLKDIIADVEVSGAKVALLPSDTIESKIQLKSASASELLDEFDDERIRSFIADANSAAAP